MRNVALLPFSLCLLAAAPAFAHDTRPANWCPAGYQQQVVSSFDLSTSTLIAYRAAHDNDDMVLGSTCSTPKSCGIVDEWFWANQAATETCIGHQVRGGYSGTVVPRILSPDTFNHDEDADGDGISDHHRDYRFKDGLTGVCVVCTPATQPGSSNDAGS